METEVAMEVVEREQEALKRSWGTSGDRKSRKYYYVLPSGRKMIVVLDEESDQVLVPT